MTKKKNKNPTDESLPNLQDESLPDLQDDDDNNLFLICGIFLGCIAFLATIVRFVLGHYYPEPPDDDPDTFKKKRYEVINSVYSYIVYIIIYLFFSSYIYTEYFKNVDSDYLYLSPGNRVLYNIMYICCPLQFILILGGIIYKGADAIYHIITNKNLIDLF